MFHSGALTLVLFTVLTLVTGIKVLQLSHDTWKHETFSPQNISYNFYTTHAQCHHGVYQLKLLHNKFAVLATCLVRWGWCCLTDCYYYQYPSKKFLWHLKQLYMFICIYTHYIKQGKLSVTHNYEDFQNF